jgi:tRNA(fMet)-specific endonuclease VapC
MANRLEAYQGLRRHLENYSQVPILDFDEVAAEEFQRLKRARFRVGTMDLMIGAIALSHGATLLSRNIVDFSRIPGLKLEDWTQ